MRLNVINRIKVTQEIDSKEWEKRHHTSINQKEPKWIYSYQTKWTLNFQLLSEKLHNDKVFFDIL